jgi:hypothetical protein
VVVVTALLAAGACGSGGAGADERERTPAEQMRELVGPLARLTSYELMMTVGDADGRLRMTGVQQLRDGRIVEADFSVDGPDEHYEMRLLDDTFFVGDGEDDGWVSVATDDPDIEDLGLAAEDLDVAASMLALADGVVDVRERPGRIVVDGDATRIVDVDVDPSQVEDLRTVLGPLTGVESRLTYQLLVDDDGVVRRFTVWVPDGSSAVEVQATITDPGLEVDVEEPAEHLPVTVQELMGDEV